MSWLERRLGWERTPADGPLGLLALLCAIFLAGLFGVSLTAAETLQRRAEFNSECAVGAVSDSSMAWPTILGLFPAALLCTLVLAGILATLHQLFRTRAMLRQLGLSDDLPAELESIVEELGLAEGSAVLLADSDLVFTFCYGLLKPKICLSQGLLRILNGDELRAVLRHEQHHLRQFDPLKILLSRSLASACFPLPAAAPLRDAYLSGKEICADRAVMVDSEGRRSLAAALHKMLQASRPVWPSGVLAIGAINPMEARLMNLLDPEALRPELPSRRDWLYSSLIAFAIFSGGMFANTADAAGVDGSICSAPAAAETLRAEPARLPERPHAACEATLPLLFDIEAADSRHCAGQAFCVD